LGGRGDLLDVVFGACVVECLKIEITEPYDLTINPLIVPIYEKMG